MAFNVRIFGYRGTRLVPKHLPRQFSSDSLQVLDEPYVWKQLLVADVAAVESAAEVTDEATIIVVEIPDDQAIRYEINYPGRAAIAANGSPRLAGTQQLHWGAGFTISIIDAAALP